MISPNPATSRTLSEVDHAEFLSALSQSQSQTPSRTISEADFMSAVGDGDGEDDDFDVLSPRSAGSSASGDGFDIGDDSSEADSWASVSQPRR